MAADTKISASGGNPQVTVSGGNLIRYRCQFFLEKPAGQNWPGTNSPLKFIHEVKLNKDHPPTDTFSLGDPAALEDLSLNWAIDMNIPGGVGGPLQFFAEVKVEQDGDEVMETWSETGQLTTPQSISGFSEIKVNP